MPHVTTLLSARYVVPIEPTNLTLHNYSVAIDENGQITDLLQTEVAKKKYPNVEEITFPNHVLMPGLINTHMHSPMTFFRGIADDLPLMTWLRDYMWPVEKRWLSDEMVKDAVSLSICEMLKSGTTCFYEHYSFPEGIIGAILPSKIRAMVGIEIIKFLGAWNRDTDDCIRMGEPLFEKYAQEKLLTINLAPHAPYSLDDIDLVKIAKLAHKHDSSIHMHVHETKVEIENSLRKYGIRPLKRLREFELFDFPFLAVHMTQVNNEDLNILKKHPHISVAHCPYSNLKLASGICPTQKLLDNGINVSIGTDGPASNNDSDMFSELRLAALLAKGETGDPTAVPAHQALRMATLNGAKVFGLDEKIGSIEVGKMADLIAIDLSSCNTQPVYNPISHLVYAVNNRQVSDLWVAGKRLLENGTLTTLDEKAIIAKASEWAEKIKTTISN